MDQSLLHTPEGVRDIYGIEYARKLLIEQRLHEAIRLYGYQDIQTPSFEFFDVYSREIGTTPSSQLYKFFDKEGNTLTLRPDFTPSCARCAAKYFMDETRPIRLTYSGSAFTNASSLQGKLKEVTQMGVELIMEPSVEADAEMISLVVEALLRCGLTSFQIAVGEVEYFRGICSQAGLKEETEQKLRDAINAKNYFAAKELLESRKVRRDYAQVLLRLADTVLGASDLAEARQMVDNERSLQAIERLEQLYRVLEKYGVEKYVSFDLGLLGKYNYYTGVIFKGYTYGVGDAVVTGGRYDHLLSHFGKNAPAIGFVIVVDDLMEALARQDLKPLVEPEGALIFYEKGGFGQALSRARQLRAEGTRAELMPVPQNRSSYEAYERGWHSSVFLVREDGSCERLNQDG
ncbi:MAG TPA: ATP phosphoribosyltransferase regulatory subunit [Candidatus Eisenbergiella merdigallinarum]|uniref:ATP phosphoribosyltransferase regulatory subunit n=1 Tax=Candidatus Eisenbergiella merdigallinarum TaxID=2838552 RepID=A0A9D2MPX4_9FIRM|nr:ATP phosphoribosyltransferase regulatory subunit [Candidatus Eisenbergiella merdigallinarum]